MKILGRFLTEKPSQKHVLSAGLIPIISTNLGIGGKIYEDMFVRPWMFLNDHTAHGVGCGERFRVLIPHIWQDCNGSIESCALLIVSLLVGTQVL